MAIVQKQWFHEGMGARDTFQEADPEVKTPEALGHLQNCVNIRLKLHDSLQTELDGALNIPQNHNIN